MLTPDSQESPLVQALERILRCAQAQAPHVTQSMRPGLTREHIEAVLQYVPFRLSEELYQLYQWRNGSERGIGFEFLPQYRMIPLEQAIPDFQEMYEALSDQEECHWLPFLAMDSDFYAVKGSSEFKPTAPISSFSWSVGLSPKFNSLTDMMLAIAECFETGAYYFDSYSYLDYDPVQEAQTWLKYQPRRIANIEAILSNQVQHLSNQEQETAYFDLVQIEHPQALTALIQAVEELKPELRSLQFQASHAPTRFEKADAIEAAGPKQSRLSLLIRCIRQINSSEAAQYLMENSDVEPFTS